MSARGRAAARTESQDLYVAFVFQLVFQNT